MTATAYILILAAGRGRRMGGPKALMQVGGRPWWQVQRERLARVGLRQVWVVSDVVRRGIAGQAAAPERMVMADPAAPMFESLMVGLESLRREGQPRGVYVLPVDVPAPGPEVWRALADSDFPALPSHRGVHGHPVYLPWHWVQTELLSSADPELAERRERRLDRLLAPVVRVIDCDDAAAAVNLNTPDDVERWTRSADGS